MRGFPPFLMSGRCKHSKQKPMAPPDVTFIFAEDVVEWDAYLTRQFEGSGTIIQHEQVEKMTFPLPSLKAPVFSDARVVLVILSPAFLHFLDSHATESFQFTKLLKPSKTIAMLCGVSSSSIADVKNVLVSYDDWRHLEAKDKDINMVRNVIELIQEMLLKSKENERINKPKFKLIPRKVQEGNGKVYVLLARPLDENTNVRITLESNGAREVPVKKRNPYTLVFVIPDDFMQTQTMVNVHVWLGEDLLGVSPVKCVSKMVELYSLLMSVVSPYEFLCNTLGVATLHDADTLLAKSFKKNLPKSGFELLEHDIKYDRVKGKEEFPSLLHFAARHGLCELVKELLACPGSQAASNMKNVRGLTPAQLANHAGHNDVAAVIDEFLKPKHSEEKLNFEVPVTHNQNLIGTEVSNPLDYYDIPAHPVPVLHLPSTRTTGNVATDIEPEYMKMKGSQKENVMPHQNFFWENIAQKDHEDVVHLPVCNAERAKLSLLESQAKLIEIMEAYKKGASLIEVEKLHNEWKTFYQVSDADAKSTLDGLRNLYAKAQKAKLSKKHSSSFSELRQFLNSKLRRKESIGSKGSLSRKQSKDMNSMEKVCADSDAIRPMSTLSVLSNTSSSSGSSFDRLSTASAGSDSGHHSDFCDERTNKLREKFESRYHQQHRKINGSSHNISGFQKNMQSLTLNSRPPAPPPRPTKTVSRYGSLEDCKVSETPQYSVAKKSSITTFEDALNFFDFIQTDSKSSSLSNEFRSTTMKPKSLTESLSFEDPNANYDCPPPPRPSVKPVAKNFAKTLKSDFILNDPKTDYDLVPPPLPVSSPPRKQDISVCDRDQSYDIPNPSVMVHPFHRSNSISSNYDFPKTTLMDNTDIQPACTCQVSANKNSFCSVKSCCIGNKLSSLKQVNSLPSVPNTDIITSVEKEKQLKNLNESRVQIKNLNENRSVHNQYYNVCLRPPRDTTNEQRDSIPEEMAPPPPIIEKENSEEHYKMVGTPVPVPSAH